jgi:MoaA/NifB/PqqE/SkfB family radical SAM enzyme
MSLVERFSKKVTQYARSKRHFFSVMKHGTPRKWTNLALVELERKRRRVELDGHPYTLLIDPCNYCNLRCPLCPTGVNDLGRPQSMLSLAHFKKYFDPFAPYLFEAYLHNWGESLLNKQVYSMIEHAQRQNVGTNLSSNLVRLDSSDLDNIIDSGLEYLIVSLDGASQESYVKYRVRGDFNRVVENLSELLRRRNARGKKTPVVEWQFIVMKQNEHEVGQAEMLSRKLGVDLLRFAQCLIPYGSKNQKELADTWLPTTVEGRVQGDYQEQPLDQAAKPGPCFYLYRTMVVNPDGGISPCCVVHGKNRDFADLNVPTIEPQKLWNNDKYLSARSLFSSQILPGRRATVCDGCDIFEKHGSKIARRSEKKKDTLLQITGGISPAHRVAENVQQVSRTGS